MNNHNCELIDKRIAMFGLFLFGTGKFLIYAVTVQVLLVSEIVIGSITCLVCWWYVFTTLILE